MRPVFVMLENLEGVICFPVVTSRCRDKATKPEFSGTNNDAQLTSSHGVHKHLDQRAARWDLCKYLRKDRLGDSRTPYK